MSGNEPESPDACALFDRLDQLLALPNGLQQLFDDYGRRKVCQAILSEEEPENSVTPAEIRDFIDGFIASHPNMVDRRFEFQMRLLHAEK